MALSVRARTGYAAYHSNRQQRRRRAAASATAGVVTPFAFQAETNTLALGFQNAPTTNRKLWADRAIRKMKAAGIWTQGRWIGPIGADEDAWRTNWINPAEKLTKTGTPTFTADTSIAGAAGQNFYMTPFNANVLSQNDCAMFTWHHTTNMNGTALLSSSCVGVIDGSSNGIGIAPNSTLNVIAMRLAGASVSTASTTSDGFGLIGGSRNNSANFDIYYNGVSCGNFASASVALPALPICIGGINNNGVVSNGIVTPISFLYLGKSLTATQVKKLTAIIGEYMEAVKYGDYYFEEPNSGTAAIAADIVIYGATMQSVNAAVAIKRANAAIDVKIIGGWRDRPGYFGMAGSDLAYTDFDSSAGLGGLPRWIITDGNSQQGKSDVATGTDPAAFKVQAKRINRTARKLLKQYGIPVYYTRGITSVTKTNKRVTAMTTADGRAITFSLCGDGSYEEDLYRMAGLTYAKGREAAGTGQEANNGVEVLANTSLSLDHAGAEINVDPWLTPGDPNSGLIRGIAKVYSTFTPSKHTYPTPGSADDSTPSYNFRITMTNDAVVRIPLPNTPPSGFDIADYELLLRWLAAATANAQPLVITDIFKMDEIQGTGRFDVNNGAGTIFSTDLFDASKAYPLASYEQREIIWKQHWNYTLGLWYVLQYYPDSRVPSALRTQALTWGLCSDHHYSVHENDNEFEPTQLYVREAIRAVSDVVMNANHIAQPDGQTPTLGTHTASHASYGMDSHGMFRFAYEKSPGVWTVRSEGGMLISAGSGGSCGADRIGPLPFEIFVPKVAECTNMAFFFGGSMTHIAYGASRMEYTAMQTAYTMGWALALALAGDGIIQNVNYTTLRTAVLASAANAGEVAPLLQQVT